jgi:hypothetical protein
MGHLAALALNNSFILGFLCYILIFVPIMGIWAVHKFKWEHWEPFTKSHK